MTGYAAREDLIRDHWERYGFHWDLKKHGPRFSVPVRHKLYPSAVSHEVDLAPATPVLDKLEFCFETGLLERRPAYRITCEGVVVEEGHL